MNILVAKPKHMQSETISQDVLASDFEVNLVQASTGKRFANLIIDLVVFYLLFFAFAILMAIANPQSLEAINYDESNAGASLLDRLLTMLMLAIYFGVVEALFKGKTVGKFITGTRAVYESNGENISVATAFARGFSRIVPFEAFSAFGNPSYPWHDKWTDTIVIDEKQSNR
jgi:uncharacterized RDD family membrane protein YckC